jgi:hypothetical protein
MYLLLTFREFCRGHKSEVSEKGYQRWGSRLSSNCITWFLMRY